MNMCPTNKCKTPPELCLKGQVFFIYTNFQSLESVKDRISLLGGKVDPFLSRDVTTVLVEDNHLVGPQLLSPDLTVKSAYGANGSVVTSFPYPNSLCNIPSTSRGYNFIATNTSNSPYRVICYARQWGIKVLGIDQFLTWIEPQVKTATRQKKKATENVSNLSGCFIKFESLHKNYRPCYKMFNNDPNRLLPLKNANILVKPETCNVILDKPVGSRQLHFSHMDTAERTTHQGKGANYPVKVNDKKPQNNRLKPKEENNYCECCKNHFADLKQHIKSARHLSFVSNEKNYESVHNILKMLPTAQEFIEKIQNPSPNSDSLLTNGDTSLCMPVANIPETDYSVPLNLQTRRENVPGFIMPLDLHIEKTNILSIPPNLQPKEEQVPLDLQVKRDNDVNVKTKETDVKQETNLFINLEHVDSCKKADTNIVQPKIEVQNDSVVESIKVEEKQIVETPEEMQCDEMNGDSLLLDRNNTAALAQLCLKNFDSYWLDSLPCEMDDMVFDDIFDFDDGKKLDNECLENFVENFVTSDAAQTPGLVSGISTPSIKTQTNENTSTLMNNSVDVKDCIKTEPHNQSIPPTCKLEKDFVTLSPQNIAASYHESLLEGKKQIFSIASFCSDKIGIEATPSCSNAVPSKHPEQLFSSESSDDENGNVLISNALNIITNSDSDMKIDKDSSEENSIQGQCEGKDLPVKSYPISEMRADKICDETTHVEGSPMNVQINPLQTNKESSLLIQSSSVSEMKMDIDSCKENNLRQTVTTNEIKVDNQSCEVNCKQNEFTSQHDSICNKESYASPRKRSYSDISSENYTDNLVPLKSFCSEELNVNKQNNLSSFIIGNELHYKMKTDPESHKENTSLESKVWDISSNEIYKQTSTVVNGTIDEIRKFEEVSDSIQNLCTDKLRGCSESKEKYLIPKKKVSFYDKRAKQNNSERNFVSVRAVPCEKKIDQTITSVKALYSKEEKVHERMKESPVLVKKCYTNETKIKKDIKERDVKSLKVSANPSQYSNRKAKYNAIISSNALPIKSSVKRKTVKIPHTDKSSKLRKLPPLWSVSVLPGSGVKLKFTCIHSKKIDTHQSENRG